MTKNKLYTLILAACFFGFGWLFFLKFIDVKKLDLDLTICLFKRITNLPCPSCGTTRAVSSLFNGEILKSLYLNPFGIIVAVIMLVSPFWIILDFIQREQSFFDFYCKIEKFLKKKEIAISLIVLVIFNWIWNLYKHL
jgi:hypothetical protein